MRLAVPSRRMRSLRVQSGAGPGGGIAVARLASPKRRFKRCGIEDVPSHGAYAEPLEPTELFIAAYDLDARRAPTRSVADHVSSENARGADDRDRLPRRPSAPPFQAWPRGTPAV